MYIKEKEKSQEILELRIVGANKGGILASIRGIPAFLPVSQLSPEHYPKVEGGDKKKILKKLKSFNKIEFENKLKFIKDIKKQPVFTAAYMVSGYKKFGFDSKIKNVSIIFDKLCKNFNEFYSKIENAKTSEEVYKTIKSQDGFGNFLSYQVLVDLLYPLKIYDNNPLLPFSNDDWSSPGPGAKIGIKLVLRNNIKIKPLYVITWLRDNQEKEFSRLNLDFKYLLDFIFGKNLIKNNIDNIPA